MKTKKDMTIREKIIHDYAKWTSFSGTRSGCPMKSRGDVYPLIECPDYELIIRGDERILKEEFNEWHKHWVGEIISKSLGKLPVGWAAKLINLYLKTYVYTAQYGRPNLINCIHPPIDGGLWEGIEEYCKGKGKQKILEKTHYKRKIKDIVEYKDYQIIIEGMSEIADKEKCLLIEVEQFWKGTDYKSRIISPWDI